jgi:peptidyl-dipeptidase A
MKKFFSPIFLSLLIMSCNSDKKDAQAFLDSYNKKYQELITRYSEAQWASNVKIVEGDSTNAVATRKAGEEFAKYTGSSEIVEKAKNYLEKKEKLTPLQVKQLEKILYVATNNPESAGEMVKERIKAETAQTERLFGFEFRIDGKPVTPNDIDEILAKETDLKKRLKTWEASKEVGKVLKDGLENLRELRRQSGLLVIPTIILTRSPITE